jgi:hypothetical protein
MSDETTESGSTWDAPEQYSRSGVRRSVVAHLALAASICLYAVVDPEWSPILTFVTVGALYPVSVRYGNAVARLKSRDRLPPLSVLASVAVARVVIDRADSPTAATGRLRRLTYLLMVLGGGGTAFVVVRDLFVTPTAHGWVVQAVVAGFTGYGLSELASRTVDGIVDTAVELSEPD